MIRRTESKVALGGLPVDKQLACSHGSPAHRRPSTGRGHGETKLLMVKGVLVSS